MGVDESSAFVFVRLVAFFAIVLTALSLVPVGAHLFELLNKIDLAAEQYFIVQNIYRGWNLFAFVLIPAMIANFVLAVMVRTRPFAAAMAFLAGACMVATLLIFFIWVEPANRATDYWTTIPTNWEVLRRQWEFGHAANALVTFIAFCSVTLAALNAKE
jgi:hypothetical protein